MITICVAILRLYYNKGIRGDSHFIAFYDSVAIKDYDVAGGHVYILHHSLPFGIKATSLLGSIRNLFSLCYCTKSFNLKKFSYVVGGDDFLVLINKLYFKERNRIKKEMLDKAVELGMKFKFLKTKNAGVGRNVRFFSKFYKYTI